MSRLDVDHNSLNPSKEWKHWKRTFENFITECGANAPNKFRSMVNFVSSNVYDYIEDCTTYEEVIRTLDSLYIKTPNETFSRHQLLTRKQTTTESLDDFLQELKKLSKNCNYQNVTAEKYREEQLRDAFITGISSNYIHQRLLKNATLDLQSAFNQARALGVAQKNSEAYIPEPVAAAVAADDTHQCSPSEQQLLALPSQKKCSFCGHQAHIRKLCPARDATCFSCNIKGHFSSVCRAKNRRFGNQSATAALFKPSLCAVSSGCPQSLLHASVQIETKDQFLTALVDSCSSESFISESAVKRLNIKTFLTTCKSSMALTTLESELVGCCTINFSLNNTGYEHVTLGVLKNLCSDVILGYDFQKQHNKLIFPIGGEKPDLVISQEEQFCALAAAQIEIPSLFSGIPENVKPIATKSRRFNTADQEFIDSEVLYLLQEDIIEPCYSPWMAQVIVAKDPSNQHKKRLCIDYSQTVNLHTNLDAYPLPRIDDMVNKV